MVGRTFGSRAGRQLISLPPRFDPLPALQTHTLPPARTAVDVVAAREHGDILQGDVAQTNGAHGPDFLLLLLLLRLHVRLARQALSLYRRDA